MLSSSEFSGVHTTSTAGEIRVQRGQFIESNQIFYRPITVEAEMKTDGSSECISMTLFAQNGGKNSDISLEIGGWATKWRFFPNI